MERGVHMKIKARYYFLAAVLLLYLIYVVTRFSSYSCYSPLSRRFFNFDAEQVAYVMLQEGETGGNVIYEEEQEKTEVLQQLNDLRYRYWLPEIPVAHGGWQFRVFVEFKNGDWESFMFNRQAIYVRGVGYRVEEESLLALIERI